MKDLGGNLERLKLKNRQIILKLLNNHEAMSRKDIAQTISLTSASVTQLCTEMIDEGLIIEIGESKEQKKVGRKKVFIDINYKNRYALCINIEKFTTTICLADLQGQVISLNKIKTNNKIEATKFILQISDICNKLLSINNIEKVIGVGVSIRGLVDNQKGLSKHAYEIWDSEVNIKSLLEKELKFPVVVQNNMRAFAQAEIIYGIGRQYNDLLFLKWYPGVGSALVIDGTVYEGNHGKAAEIGHYIVDFDGQRCKCGKTGCLETKVSFDAVVNSIRLIYSKQTTPILYELTNGQKENIALFLENYLVTYKNNMDFYVLEIIDKAIIKLAQVTVNAATIVAPQKIIVYGKFFENKKILNRFKKEFKLIDITYDDDLIIESKLMDRTHYIGALAIAVEEFFFKVGGI
ncbi:hypothetical protein AN639_06555 [Candidatus Epulonipiscium fishelsonii]|uniref:Uncharacterized protein n=1 Tax=Candidatus Epulonipiscium fishelsonii TaxID=77094 RepID=A0ACC8XCD6_9FIRM|nr:hypothetical protein AN639_06555 [Epulopiscium sp. SCG-B05WGA-EpuloA1]ONI40420.1 hypothetical protein AN396_06325 [Epulopiscium sp. SCG-B11WGA-EpuloA1]